MSPAITRRLVRAAVASATALLLLAPIPVAAGGRGPAHTHHVRHAHALAQASHQTALTQAPATVSRVAASGHLAQHAAKVAAAGRSLPPASGRAAAAAPALRVRASALAAAARAAALARVQGGASSRASALPRWFQRPVLSVHVPAALQRLIAAAAGSAPQARSVAKHAASQAAAVTARVQRAIAAAKAHLGKLRAGSSAIPGALTKVVSKVHSKLASAASSATGSARAAISSVVAAVPARPVVSKVISLVRSTAHSVRLRTIVGIPMGSFGHASGVSAASTATAGASHPGMPMGAARGSAMPPLQQLAPPVFAIGPVAPLANGTYSVLAKLPMGWFSLLAALDLLLAVVLITRRRWLPRRSIRPH